MNKNIIISFIGLTLPALAGGANLFESKDSVKVVKGQISDYYIPVHTTYDVTGVVTDEQGQPLEGATVMFFASPLHHNTDRQGRYKLTVTDGDKHLYVYYPGKEYSHYVREPHERSINIVMKPRVSTRKNTARRPPQSTPWYNPAAYVAQTFCNPMNISYNYEPFNNNVKANGSFRSAADPMALMFKGRYLLFSTNQGGFHHSKNLSDWDFTTASFQRRPTDDDQCAPAAFVSGDTLYYTGSTYEGLPIWYATDPYSGRWRRAIDKNDLPTWDPAYFLDDDGKLYVYYGSSNEYPLKAVEVSRDDFSPIGKIHDVVLLRPDKHGWERFGMNNDDEVTLKPFTEGAFMTKHNGKYYLQYGAPGTEFKTYADGVYVGDSPLGPFTYQKHNPMSYKPGGFVQGVGHGGTFADAKGNYWHVGTCMLSLKYKFERRIGLYPVGFDKDGVMYSSTAFGDYPSWNADRDMKNPTDRFVGWMLLSYRKPVRVSSTDSTFTASSLTDEHMRTFWAAKSGGQDEWVEMDLEQEKNIQAIQLNFYDYKTVQHNRANDLYHQYRILASNDGKEWFLVVDKSQNDKDVPHDYVELATTLKARYLRVENVQMPSNGHFCLSDIRVFGSAEGKQPDAVPGLNIQRDKKDKRNAIISWKKSARAYGYNIYFGVAPDKLYNCITVLDETQYDFRGMDRDTDYYFSLEAVGETGVSEKSKVVKSKK
ncbi:MAG: family 43 glycosylhydrolase [Prevotellaceae bacterium]|nr:family 43 glycosylhydrolase [Prevotellaceae bacterium]MDY3365647.1 family 43 glycosylhydrolase [Prevotella sp.]